MSGWQQARHESDGRLWTSYSLILPDGSYIVVSPDRQQPGTWKWMRYRTFPGADEDAQATCTEFTSARLAMGDAQEAGTLLAFEERRYVASWAEEKDPLERLEAAAGPLAITLPGHVLRIEDTRRGRAS